MVPFQLSPLNFGTLCPMKFAVNRNWTLSRRLSKRIYLSSHSADVHHSGTYNYFNIEWHYNYIDQWFYIYYELTNDYILCWFLLDWSLIIDDYQIDYNAIGLNNLICDSQSAKPRARSFAGGCGWLWVVARSPVLWVWAGGFVWVSYY